MLSLNGSAVSNETDYDYGLPFRVDGYDAFGGIYRGDLNLQVYWDDNADKLKRFVDTLNQTDYIFIPTNHQYAQITRLPERYPLTTLYYRELIGCPVGIGDHPLLLSRQSRVRYQGRLGFDLVAVFETYPNAGTIRDQRSVRRGSLHLLRSSQGVDLSRRTKISTSQQVRATLSSVDLTKAVHLTPRQFNDYSNLHAARRKLAQQRAGGTWSELFDYDWVQNRYPVLGLAHLVSLHLHPGAGRLSVDPPGDARAGDKGYPLSRALGLVLFGYLAWIGGSVGIPYHAHDDRDRLWLDPAPGGRAGLLSTR